MTRLHIWLPVPPSANRLHVPVGRGRNIKSAAYRSWCAEANARILQARLRRRDFEAGTTFRLRLTVPINRRRDLDNCVKPVLDILTPDPRAGVLGICPDDRWCDEVRAQRVPLPEKGPALVGVEVELLPPK